MKKKITTKNANFLDDKEKMLDFRNLTKSEFLALYSYISEEEYDNTAKEVLKSGETEDILTDRGMML